MESSLRLVAITNCPRGSPTLIYGGRGAGAKARCCLATMIKVETRGFKRRRKPPEQ